MSFFLILYFFVTLTFVFIATWYSIMRADDYISESFFSLLLLRRAFTDPRFQLTTKYQIDCDGSNKHYNVLNVGKVHDKADTALLPWRQIIYIKQCLYIWKIHVMSMECMITAFILSCTCIFVYFKSKEKKNTYSLFQTLVIPNHRETCLLELY